MTLKAFLEGLPADPTGPSPPLIVAEGLLSTAQREQVIASPHNRRPYCVVVGLPRGAPVRLHNRRSKLTGAVDVHLMHPPTGTTIPDGEALAHLQALILNAMNDVTEIRAGYALAEPLTLVNETDPRPASFDKFDGLTAVTRFTYSIWR